MRRFLAYITMMLTMVCAIVFNTQAVLDYRTEALEFGTGYEMVYSLTYREPSDYDLANNTKLNNDGTEPLTEIDIEGEIMDRLDLAGVRNADVKIVQGDSQTQEGYQLRISLSPLNEGELNRVKQVIGITGDLAIGTIGDDVVMYENADKFFDNTDGDLASIVYNGTTPYPAIKVKQADYDEMVTAAEEASQAHPEVSSRIKRAEGDEEEEDNSSICYLWTNKTLDDTYDRAFGTNDTVVQEEVKAKVLATLDLNNYNSEDNLLIINQDAEGNAFNISSARAFVNMLNATDYGFDIEFLYQNLVSAAFGAQTGIMYSFIALGVVILLICAFMICFYGLAGLTGVMSLLVTTMITFLLFSLLGFEYSVAAIVALIVVVLQSLAISLNYFERVKGELKRGRDIEKSNAEGYHKSFFNALDLSAVVLIASLFSFLIAVGSYKTFFGVVMIGSIFSFLITNYINKWMMYWLCKDNHATDKKYIFGFFSKSEEKKRGFALSKSGKMKKLTWLLPLAVSAVLAVALPVTYLTSEDDSFFNSSADFSSSYTLDIAFSGESQRYNALSEKETFIQYLRAIGLDEGTLNDSEGYLMLQIDEEIPEEYSSLPVFHYDFDTAYVNIVEKADEEGNAYYVHYFSVTIDNDLSQIITADGNDVRTVINNSLSGEDILIDESTSIGPVTNYSHYITDSLSVYSLLVKPTNIQHNYQSLFLLIFLLSLFVSCYTFIRFSVATGLTTLIAGTTLSGIAIALLSVLRIPFTSYTGFGLLAAVLIFQIFLVLALGGNKEILKERGLKDTEDDKLRQEIADEVASRALKSIIPVDCIAIVFALSLLVINSSLLGLSLSLIVLSVIAFAVVYLYSVPLYYALSTRISFKKLRDKREEKRVKKGKEKKTFTSKDGIEYVDEGSHETIIVGLNDFHHTK